MQAISIAIMGFVDAECKELGDMFTDHSIENASVVLNTSSPLRLISALESGVHLDILYLGMTDEEYPAMALNLARTVQCSCPWVQIVFWSLRPEHVMLAHEVFHAFFLLRPFSKQFVERSLDESFRRLLDLGDRPFALRIGSSMVKLRPSEILYAESFGHKVMVHVYSGYELDAYLRLVQLMEFLPQSFVRTHKSFLVNMNHAVSLCSKVVELSNGVIIPVSRSHRKEVRDAFARSCSFVMGSCTL